MRAFCSLLGIAIILSSGSGPRLQAQPGAAGVWRVSVAAGGRQVASIRTGGAMRGMSIGCQGSVPMLLVAAPRHRASARANLELTGTVDGNTITVPMIWNPQAGAWWSILRDRSVPDLLSGASSSLFLAMNGISLGTVPLTGSSNAVRTALGNCYAPAASPPAAAGGGGATNSRNSLPLRFGTYVRAGKKCGRDTNAQVFIDAGRGGAGDAMAIGTIESLRKSGPNTYVAREDVGVQDNAVTTATYTIVDREHFTVRSRDYGTKSFAYCSLNALPRDQQQWPENEHKVLALSPIKPGYYHGNGDDKQRCEIFCSYVLVRNDGIASVSYGSGTGEVMRHALRSPRIVQTGALTFEFTGRRTDDMRHYFRIESPTQFVEEDGETTFVFRPIDPAKIPARFMPRL